jgi:hypothetical protein
MAHPHPDAAARPGRPRLHTYLGFLAAPELRLGAFVAVIWLRPAPAPARRRADLNRAEHVPLTIKSHDDHMTDRRTR